MCTYVCKTMRGQYSIYFTHSQITLHVQLSSSPGWVTIGDSILQCKRSRYWDAGMPSNFPRVLPWAWAKLEAERKAAALQRPVPGGNNGRRYFCLSLHPPALLPVSEPQCNAPAALPWQLFVGKGCETGQENSFKKKLFFLIYFFLRQRRHFVHPDPSPDQGHCTACKSLFVSAVWKQGEVIWKRGQTEGDVISHDEHIHGLSYLYMLMTSMWYSAEWPANRNYHVPFTYLTSNSRSAL